VRPPRDRFKTYRRVRAREVDSRASQPRSQVRFQCEGRERWSDEWALRDSNPPPLPCKGRTAQISDQRFRSSALLSGVTGVPASTTQCRRLLDQMLTSQWLQMAPWQAIVLRTRVLAASAAELPTALDAAGLRGLSTPHPPLPSSPVGPRISASKERQRGQGGPVGLVDVHVGPTGFAKLGGRRQGGRDEHHMIKTLDQGHAVVHSDLVGGVADREHVSQLVSGDRHRCSPVSGCARHLHPTLAVGR